MANPYNLKENKWYPYIAHIGDNRNSYGHDEICLRIIQCMEMAYAEGLRLGREQGFKSGESRIPIFRMDNF